jgi:ribosome-binding factor A
MLFAMVSAAKINEHAGDHIQRFLDIKKLLQRVVRDDSMLNMTTKVTGKDMKKAMVYLQCQAENNIRIR